MSGRENGPRKSVNTLHCMAPPRLASLHVRSPSIPHPYRGVYERFRWDPTGSRTYPKFPRSSAGRAERGPRKTVRAFSSTHAH